MTEPSENELPTSEIALRESEICCGPVETIPSGEGRAFVVGERTIAVFRISDGTFYATQDTCPHANASLAEGLLGAVTVICPRHGWKFNLKTGACQHDPAYRIRTYPVRVEDGQIIVTLPAPVIDVSNRF